ncbi:MAG: hypothetical protein WA947_17330 [Phormidesmis sp.]
MPLVDLKAFSRVSLTSVTVASGVQLILLRSASAYPDHNMAEMAEPSESLEQTVAPEEQNPAQPESAAAEANARETLPEQMHSDMEEAMPSMDHHGNENTVPETPATQGTAPVTEAGISNSGFSFGLGESLLGLVIVGPVVLMALKKRF